MPKFKKNPNPVMRKTTGGGPSVMKKYGHGKNPIMMKSPTPKLGKYLSKLGKKAGDHMKKKWETKKSEITGKVTNIVDFFKA